jgi:hypothetical protein
MNMPNLASVHHFILRAFWASVSLGSWAIEIWETVSKTIAAIRSFRVFVFMGSVL